MNVKIEKLLSPCLIQTIKNHILNLHNITSFHYCNPNDNIFNESYNVKLYKNIRYEFDPHNNPMSNHIVWYITIIDNNENIIKYVKIKHDDLMSYQ